jgi:hypothetical protein
VRREHYPRFVVVDVPNYVVSALLPEAIFDGA